MTEAARKRWAERLQPGDSAIERYSTNLEKNGRKVRILKRREVERGCESGVWLTAKITNRYGTTTEELDSHWFWPLTARLLTPTKK